VEALEPLSQEYLTGQYADIPSMYREACYQYANQLYSAKKPFQALVYYKQIMDYRDVAESRVKKMVYQLIGTWEMAKGGYMEFREDGTCTIDNRNYYFFAPNIYALHIGDEPDDMTYTYEIVTYSDQYLTLRHVKQKTIYRMTRVKD
jgi:hypothetical protein